MNNETQEKNKVLRWQKNRLKEVQAKIHKIRQRLRDGTFSREKEALLRRNLASQEAQLRVLKKYHEMDWDEAGRFTDDPQSLVMLGLADDQMELTAVGAMAFHGGKKTLPELEVELEMMAYDGLVERRIDGRWILTQVGALQARAVMGDRIHPGFRDEVDHAIQGDH